MIIKDSFKKTVNLTGVLGCLAFFTNEKFDFKGLKKYFKATEHSKIFKLIKNSSKRKFSNIFRRKLPIKLWRVWP